MRMRKAFVSFLCGLAIVFTAASLRGAEHIDIWRGGKERVHCGIVYGNNYGMAGFLNPSTSASRIYQDDFVNIPRVTVKGTATADEREARARFFLRPDVKIRTIGRRSMVMHGKTQWKLEKIANGVKYSRDFVYGGNTVSVEITAVMPPEQAEMFVEYTVKNNGEVSCSMESMFNFSFLRNGVEPLEVSIQRETARFINGERTTLRCNEHTVLDGKTKYYWWRKQIKDQKAVGNYYNREKIPFNNSQMHRPEVFGCFKLKGGNTLVWDLGKNSDVDLLDMSWEGEVASIMPVWQKELAPGKVYKGKFRMLLFKGVPRIDLVGKKWVFGFFCNEDKLKIYAVALQPVESSLLVVTVNDENNLLLINQRCEIPSITPFTPGTSEMRAAYAFRSSSVYPIKVILSRVRDNHKILELAENIIP